LKGCKEVYDGKMVPRGKHERTPTREGGTPLCWKGGTGGTDAGHIKTLQNASEKCVWAGVEGGGKGLGMNNVGGKETSPTTLSKTARTCETVTGVVGVKENDILRKYR